jgi:hypothetical protein
MKLLAFTDMHESLTALNRVKKKSKNVDVVVCCGDISIFEGGLEFMMEELSKIKKEIIVVHGNHEDEKNMKRLCKAKNVHFIHKNKKKIGDILFIGYGGGGFDLEDPEFEGMTNTFKKWIKESKSKKVILITHAPPHDTKLDDLYGESVGNISFREFLINEKVDIMLCGHLHENFNKKDKLKETVLINPGPDGKIINI